MLIYFWESESQSRRKRERDIESEAGSRLRAVSTEPDPGLEPMNCEIMTWAEVRCLANWATQAPLYFLIVAVLMDVRCAIYFDMYNCVCVLVCVHVFNVHPGSTRGVLQEVQGGNTEDLLKFRLETHTPSLLLYWPHSQTPSHKMGENTFLLVGTVKSNGKRQENR